ncbi:MAG: hypothetical protein ACRCV0_07460 [Brevinema sp.]
MNRICYVCLIFICTIISCSVQDSNVRLFNYRIQPIKYSRFLLDPDKTMLASHLERVDPDLKNKIKISSDKMVEFIFGPEYLWDNISQSIVLYDGLMKYLLHSSFPPETMVWQHRKVLPVTQYIQHTHDAEGFKEISLYWDTFANRMGIFCSHYEGHRGQDDFKFYKFSMKESSYEIEFNGINIFQNNSHDHMPFINDDFVLYPLTIHQEYLWERDKNDLSVWKPTVLKKPDSKKRMDYIMLKKDPINNLLAFIDVSSYDISYNQSTDILSFDFSKKRNVDHNDSANPDNKTKELLLDIYVSIP